MGTERQRVPVTLRYQGRVCPGPAQDGWGWAGFLGRYPAAFAGLLWLPILRVLEIMSQERWEARSRCSKTSIGSPLAVHSADRISSCIKLAVV